MLYQLLKPVGVTGINLFFNSISVENQERIPNQGPLIFVANHPNTMMDPLIVGANCNRRVSFLARSTLFSNKVFAWLLGLIGIIPVYRKIDAEGDMVRNEEMFAATHRHLEKGRALLIFPEGISTPERIIHKVKTGAARIGLGAEENNDFNLNVQIVPAGINYSAGTKFRSDVHCRFGHPIAMADFQEQYKADDWSAVQAVTIQLRQALKKLTTTVTDQANANIVQSLETIYKKELTVDLGMDKYSKDDEFKVSKGIIRAVEWFSENKPKWSHKLKQSIMQYTSILDKLKIRDDFLSTSRSKVTLGRRLQSWFFLVFGFPIFIYGWILNYLPYKLSGILAVRAVKGHYADLSSKKMLFGMGLFIVWYAGILVLFYNIINDGIWTALFFLTFIPSGNFTLLYFRKAQNYGQHLRFMSIFYQKRRLLYQLIEKRISIIHELNRAKEEYFSKNIRKNSSEDLSDFK